MGYVSHFNLSFAVYNVIKYSVGLKFAYVRLLFIYRMKTVRGSLSGVWEFGI